MSDKHKLRNDTPLLEWILGGIGLLIFVAGVGFLLTRAASPEVAPTLKLEVQRVVRVENGHLVEFIASNQGSETVADLHIIAALMQGEREAERVELTMDYLPGRSQRHGGAYFERDPKNHRVKLVAQGFQDP